MTSFEPPLPNAPQPVYMARPVTAAPPINPLKLESLAQSSAAWDAAAVLAVPIVFVYGQQVALWLAGADVDSAVRPEGVPISIKAILLQTWMQAALAVGIVAYFVFRNGLPAASFGVQKHGLAFQFAVSPLVLGAVYFVAITIGLCGALLTEDMQAEAEKRARFFEQLPLGNLKMQFILILAVAIHEELIFRGLLLPLLRRVTGHWWIAVAISSGIFGLLHFPQGGLAMLTITGVGIVLSIAFILTRSVLTVALAHFAFDILQIQLSQWIFRNFEVFQSASQPS